MIAFATQITQMALCFELWLNCSSPPRTHLTAGVHPGKLLPRSCPAVPAQWAEPLARACCLELGLEWYQRRWADPSRARSCPVPVCPLWAAMGRRLARSTGPKQSPEGLLRPAAVGTTRRALRAAMPTAGSRFAARRAVQFAWSMHAGSLQAARQTNRVRWFGSPRSVCCNST